jgi:hypothetical protein
MLATLQLTRLGTPEAIALVHVRRLQRSLTAMARKLPAATADWSAKRNGIFRLELIARTFADDPIKTSNAAACQ